jgi:hypothetical protein
MDYNLHTLESFQTTLFQMLLDRKDSYLAIWRAELLTKGGRLIFYPPSSTVFQHTSWLHSPFPFWFWTKLTPRGNPSSGLRGITLLRSTMPFGMGPGLRKQTNGRTRSLKLARSKGLLSTEIHSVKTLVTNYHLSHLAKAQMAPSLPKISTSICLL